MEKVIVSGRIDGKVVQVKIEGGVIAEIGNLPASEFIGAEHIVTDGDLLPGYIDVHVHGGGGAEVMDASMEAFEQVAMTHAKHGTTGMLLTTVTESLEALDAVFSAYQPEKLHRGAEIFGFHLEGPFINPEKPGAQSQDDIIPPDVDLFRRWQGLCDKSIRYVTLAPELQGAKQFIEYASAQGVVVAMGHCNATSEEAARGIEWGAQSVTHLFNAMSGPGHRKPGLAGTALGDNRVMAELIADLIHVHPLMLTAAIRAKGTDRVMLITDAVRVADMTEGEYTLGRQQIFVQDGAVRLADGTLAGSRLTLDVAVRNLLHIGALSPGDVNQVTSLNQSRLLNLPHGRLQVGAPGNLIAVDVGWEVTHTVVRGNLVYRA